MTVNGYSGHGNCTKYQNKTILKLNTDEFSQHKDKYKELEAQQQQQYDGYM